MTPRQAKIPARPKDMPRTEGDLDVIMTTIENHKAESHRIGTLVQENKISDEDIINDSALNDARLYDVCDTIAMERDGEFTKADSELQEGKSAS